MTMDPRVEAALVEFARTKLLPPGYTMERQPGYMVSGEILYSLACGDWIRHGLFTEEAIAAAWKRSDRRSTLPTIYGVMAAYKDMSAYKDGSSDGWHAVYNPSVRTPLAMSLFTSADVLIDGTWRSESLPTIEDAREAAWDHHDAAMMQRAPERTEPATTDVDAPGEPPPTPPSKFAPGDFVRWLPNRDGEWFYGILDRRRGPDELHALEWEITCDSRGCDPRASPDSALVTEAVLILVSAREWGRATGNLGGNVTITPRVDPLEAPSEVARDSLLPKGSSWRTEVVLDAHCGEVTLAWSQTGAVTITNEVLNARIIVGAGVLRYFLDHGAPAPGKKRSF